MYLKVGRFGPYIQYEKIPEIVDKEIVKTKRKKKKKEKDNNNFKNVSIPKGISINSIDLERANFLCSLPKVIGQHPDIGKDITLNSGRFGPYLKCENKSARIETAEDIFTIDPPPAETISGMTDFIPRNTPLAFIFINLSQLSTLI